MELIRPGRDSGALTNLVGKAPAFLKVILEIPAIAKSGAPVLISGETGTGKELVARAVHHSSGRTSFPFVAVNCGSMVESLLEDELFGHERGAFTGAFRAKPGVLVEANGGTLFLDEIDTLSVKAQIDLLRVLQERKFRPVGAREDRDANIRIVAATNASLDRLVYSGVFRADLYYRLCVFSVQLPPLRERREDIHVLARHFIDKHAQPGASTKLSSRASAALLEWHWPGNVRELENAVIRGIHLCREGTIEVPDLRLPLNQDGGACAIGEFAPVHSYKSEKHQAIATFEREYLTRVMSANRGNVTRAAAAAQKERSDFRKLLKKHNLDPKAFRHEATG